jgi:hypothetical protein
MLMRCVPLKYYKYLISSGNFVLAPVIDTLDSLD